MLRARSERDRKGIITEDNPTPQTKTSGFILGYYDVHSEPQIADGVESTAHTYRTHNTPVPAQRGVKSLHASDVSVQRKNRKKESYLCQVE